MVRPLVFALVLAVSATGAWGDMYDDCDQTADPDRQIRGCTQIIERGDKETQKIRAIAYYNRGLAYKKKGELDRAIADYTGAIALDPNYAIAYNNRGYAYSRKGELDRAIADYTGGPSRSTRKMPPPTPTGALPTRRRAIMTAPSPTPPRPLH